MKFDIIGKRLIYFLISGIIILIGVISLLTFGLPAGIEFSSGSLLRVSFEAPVSYIDFKQEISISQEGCSKFDGGDVAIVFV